MIRSRRGSTPGSVAIRIVAFSIFLLQSLAAAAAPAFDAEPAFGVMCGASAPPAERRGDDRRAPHGLCCILGSVSCGCADLAHGAVVAVDLPRRSARLDWAVAEQTAVGTPLKRRFWARGPPEPL